MFSEEVINKIMRNFPRFELCYEKITHKKVLDSSAILAIPEGKKDLLGLLVTKIIVFVCY